MNIVLFSGLTKSDANAIRAMLAQWTGYQIGHVGDDIVVSDTDPKLIEGPPDVLKISKEPWVLSPANYTSYAEEYVSNIRNTALDRAPIKLPTSITVDDQYGLKTDIECEKLRFFFARGESMVDCLAKHTFPYFVEKLSLEKCYPVSVDIVTSQRRLSMQKIAYLTSEYGSNRAQALVQKEHALDSALPKAQEAMAYVDALIFFGNFAIALPIHELATALYFRSNGLCTYSSLGMENNFEQMMVGLGPMIANVAKRQQFFEKSLGNRGGDQMLPMAVKAINSLHKYLYDPRNFLDGNKLNAKQQLQAHVTVNLIMADIQATNFSASPYLRQKLALSALDKLANLWKGISRTRKLESDIFMSLLSETFVDRAAAILKSEFRAISETAARAIATSLKRSHAKVLAQVRQTIGASATDVDAIEALRALRNASHGAFLKSSQFENRFLLKATALPNEMEAIAFFLVWALCLRPKQLLGNSP